MENSPDNGNAPPTISFPQECLSDLRTRFLNSVKPIHRRIRDRKIDLFLRLARDSRTRLLDVGGGAGIDGEFLRLHSSFAEVVVVNLHEQAVESMRTALRFVRADGCALPFATNSFDWVFSNAVIEHVGDALKQKRFAEEIRRVAARGYFVATPNKHFPIEPHTFLPFYQFMPVALQRRLVRLAPGYMRKPYEINLLSLRGLQSLFPEARVRKIGFPMFPNSLVAIYKAGPQESIGIEER